MGISSMIAVALVVHYFAKSAYYAVGLSDGNIEASAGIFKRLIKIGEKIPVCTPEQQNEGMGIVIVKAETIHAITNGPATVSLCVPP